MRPPSRPCLRIAVAAVSGGCRGSGGASYDQQLVEALPSDRANESLADRVCLRCTDWSVDDPDGLGVENSRQEPPARWPAGPVPAPIKMLRTLIAEIWSPISSPTAPNSPIPSRQRVYAPHRFGQRARRT